MAKDRAPYIFEAVAMLVMLGLVAIGTTVGFIVGRDSKSAAAVPASATAPSGHSGAGLPAHEFGDPTVGQGCSSRSGAPIAIRSAARAGPTRRLWTTWRVTSPRARWPACPARSGITSQRCSRISRRRAFPCRPSKPTRWQTLWRICTARVRARLQRRRAAACRWATRPRHPDDSERRSRVRRSGRGRFAGT